MPSEPGPTLIPLQLDIRHFIAAQPARVFKAWTTPDELRLWWGPDGVRCIEAEVDLRIGGRFRLGNELPNKQVIWIEGEFENIEPPELLVYTWSTNPDDPAEERVRVRFIACDGGTEICLEHSRIPDPALRDRHAAGWWGCLHRLGPHLAKPSN